jgi:hypothetical protein
LASLVSIVQGGEKGNDSIPELAYSIMFDSLISTSKVNELIKLCSQKTAEFSCKLKSHNEAVGVISAVEFPLSMKKLEEIITALNKGQIFKTSCHFYHSDLPLNKRNEFLKKPEGTVSFIGHYEVNGKFFTSFTYNMQAKWVKSNGWIMEKGFSLPGIRQTKGTGGYINDIQSFTLVAPLENNRALRISASWDDVGGKLPVLGKIHASCQDIFEAMKNGDNDIREYFKIQYETIASRTNYDKICN